MILVVVQYLFKMEENHCYQNPFDTFSNLCPFLLALNLVEVVAVARASLLRLAPLVCFRVAPGPLG